MYHPLKSLPPPGSSPQCANRLPGVATRGRNHPGNPGKTMGKPWKTVGKAIENDGKHRENGDFTKIRGKMMIFHPEKKVFHGKCVADVMKPVDRSP